MKKILLFALFIGICASSSAQYGVENIFRKYRNDEGVINWQFSGDLSKYFTRKDDAPLKSRLDNLDFYMFNENADLSEKDNNKLTAAIDADNFELLIQLRDKGNKVKLLGIENDGSISKVFAKVNAEDKTMYFFLRGEIYLDDLNNIEMSDFIEGKLMNLD